MKQAMTIRSQSKKGAISLDNVPTAWANWTPYRVQSGGGLNLRQGPGTSHAIVTYMPASADIAVHRCERQWCELSFDGAVGYAHQDYIDQAGDQRANKLEVEEDQATVVTHPALAQSPLTLEMIDEWEAHFGTREIVESRQEVQFGGIY